MIVYSHEFLWLDMFSNQVQYNYLHRPKLKIVVIKTPSFGVFSFINTPYREALDCYVLWH
jgi:hypothetical protein